MSTNDSAREKATGTVAGAQFTNHVEPPEQGGKRFVRCTGCGREILCCIGKERLTHAEGCQNA